MIFGKNEYLNKLLIFLKKRKKKQKNRRKRANGLYLNCTQMIWDIISKLMCKIIRINLYYNRGSFRVECRQWGAYRFYPFFCPSYSYHSIFAAQSCHSLLYFCHPPNEYAQTYVLAKSLLLFDGKLNFELQFPSKLYYHETYYLY